MFSFLAWPALALADFASGLDAFDRGDYAQALSQFKPLASAGNARAEYRLGVCYAKGLGVARDFGRAVKWLRKAADQGYARAQNDLGILYDQGRGLASNPAQAAQWFGKAAAQGNGAAQFNLAQLYLDGRGVPKDPIEAFACANAASESGEYGAERVVLAAGNGLDSVQIAKAERLATEYRKKFVTAFRQY